MTVQPTHQLVTTRCANCAWTYVGTLEQGKKRHTTHRRRAHGIDAQPTKKRKGRSPWSSHTPLADNITAARKQGAARWYDGRETL